MKRVAALYLPLWPIDRLRQAERRAQRKAAPTLPVDLDPMRQVVDDEQEHACSVPRGGGWRPGARWARHDPSDRVAQLPDFRQPAQHEIGRRDEAARPPFRAMRPDEGAPPAARLFLPEIVSGRGTIHAANGGGAGANAPLTRRPLHPAASRRGPPPPDKIEELAPLVTSQREGNRMLIGAACPRALALGLKPGMPITQARAMVQGLDIRPADPEGDRQALHRLALALARRWTPHVSLEGDDTLFLDLTGVAHLHGGEARMGRRLIQRLARRGVTARMAIADTPGAAWALSRHAPGICPPGAHGAALAPLPIEALRLETQAIELLGRLGVETIGQLSAMPRGPLVRRFGKALALRLDQAMGHLSEPIAPVIPREPIAIVQRFAEPIATPEAIAHWLGELVRRLAGSLAQAGIGARRIELVADRVDGMPQCLSIGLARPNRDPVHLLKLMLRRIEEIEPGYGVDALALHLRRADPLAPQPIGEGLGDEAPDLAPLIDALANRIGTRRLWRCRPVESDVPERSVASAAPLDPPERAAASLKADDVRRLDRRAPELPWHARWPRPARLLARPELLDHVIAELPDQPPRRFTWRGQSHSVVRADGPERITGEWWRHPEETLAVRDYFQVEDSEGRRFWLFRRGDGTRPATGDLSWYLHGMFG